MDAAPWHGDVALVLPVRRASEAAPSRSRSPTPGIAARLMRCFNGHGAVRLLDADGTGLVLLMERAGAGTLAEILATSSNHTVEQAIEIAGALAHQLSVPAAADTLLLRRLRRSRSGQWQGRSRRSREVVGVGRPWRSDLIVTWWAVGVCADPFTCAAGACLIEV